MIGEIAFIFGWYEGIVSFMQLVVDQQDQLITALRGHMMLVAVPVGCAVLVAIPVGIIATRNRYVEFLAIGFANIMQTVPSLALIALMIPLGMGIGRRPAYVALFLYAILPILRNTYAGISGVDAGLKKAARGMGMTDFQVLKKIELPLAAPVIMAGLRTATVIIIGTAVLAAYVGGGGLGSFIMTGLGLVRDQLILLGAIPSALLALLTDFVLGRVEEWVTPEGLKV